MRGFGLAIEEPVPLTGTFAMEPLVALETVGGSLFGPLGTPLIESCLTCNAVVLPFMA